MVRLALPTIQEELEVLQSEDFLNLKDGNSLLYNS